MARTPTNRGAGLKGTMDQILGNLNKWSDENLKTIQAERKQLTEDFQKGRIDKKTFEEADKKVRQEETKAKRENTKATNRLTRAYGDMGDDLQTFDKTVKEASDEMLKFGAGFDYLADSMNDLGFELETLNQQAGEQASAGDQEGFNLSNELMKALKSGTLTDELRNKVEQGGTAVDQDALGSFDAKTQANARAKGNVDDVIDKFTSFGNSISGTLDKIPLVGGKLKSVFDRELKVVGATLRKNLVAQLQSGNISVKGMGRAFKATIPAIRAMGASLMTATGGITLILGLLAAAAVALVGLATKAKDFANKQGVAFSQSVKLQGSIMKANIQLIGTGQDASAIAGEMIDTFGRLDGINANNIKNIGRLATRFGASTKDIIGFQKAFGDLTGASADQANDVVRSVGQLATGAGVAAGKVIADISSNMESFAKFSTQGAEGLAQAAVEAAKVGGSLSVTMKAAESLLSFESSLTAEYEAQVLTGKTLNLERARQLALEGDIGKLTTEISKQIGSVGDIGKMNAIAKQSLADSIGISVGDLLKISRGEAAEVGETQEDLQRKTNDILTAGFQGNKDELTKLNSKPGNGDSGMYDEFNTL